MLLLPLAGFSQTAEVGDIGKIWSNPVVYNFNEKVSWYFDLSNTTFAENEDVYIWIWSPSEPDAGNWENSSDFAKLTYVGNMVWRFDLTPTEYFKKTVDEIKASAGFWLRLKDKKGTKQTGVTSVPITDFSGFATSGKMVDYYPKNFTIDQPMSILFNANLAPDEKFKTVESIYMHGGLNDFDENALQEYQAWLPDVSDKVRLVDMGNGIYRKDIIPRTYFNASEDYVMRNIAFLFVGKDWSCTTPNQIIYAPDVPVPPPAELYFIPQKFSQKDILCIIRKYNESGVNKLTYKLVAGAKEVTGTFEGNKDEMRAYINLLNELQGATGLTSVKVTISDNKGRTILDVDMPLVNLNQ